MARRKLTWGDLKGWADANGVSDEAVIKVKETGQTFEDLDSYEAEPADAEYGDPGRPAELLLQMRYG